MRLNGEIGQAADRGSCRSALAVVFISQIFPAQAFAEQHLIEVAAASRAFLQHLPLPAGAACGAGEWQHRLQGQGLRAHGWSVAENNLLLGLLIALDGLLSGGKIIQPDFFEPGAIIMMSRTVAVWTQCDEIVKNGAV